MLGLRDAGCQMSTFDVYELAQHLTFPNPALDTNKKVAVVIKASERFNHAQLMQLCALNKSANVGAFEDTETVNDWLYPSAAREPNKSGIA